MSVSITRSTVVHLVRIEVAPGSQTSISNVSLLVNMESVLTRLQARDRAVQLKRELSVVPTLDEAYLFCNNS